MESKYKIINRNDTCVLLERRGIYKIIDIESDTIYIGTDEEKALKVFNEYDIEEVRKRRKEIFEHWLEINAE